MNQYGSYLTVLFLGILCLGMGCPSPCMASVTDDYVQGRGLYWEGQWEAAMAVLMPIASAVEPTQMDYLDFMVASCLKNVGRHSEALTFYRKVEAESANKGLLAEARICVMGCYQSMKDWNGALAVCQRYAGEHPAEAGGWDGNAATCLTRLGRHSEAIALFQKSEATSTNKKTLLASRRGIRDCYKALSDWNNCLAACQKYASEFPDEAVEWDYHVAHCLTVLGRHSEALAIYRKVVAGSTDKAVVSDARTSVVGCYQSMNDWNSALALCQEYAVDFSDEVGLWQHCAGHCLRRLGKYSEAIEWYKKAETSPASREVIADSGRSIVECYMSMSDWKSALSVLEQYETALPDGVAEWEYDQATCLKNLGRYSEALALYQKVQAGSADEATKFDARICIMGCHQSMNDWNAALAVCQKYAVEHPDEAAEWDCKAATCLTRLGRHSEALPLFQRAEATSTKKETRLAARQGIMGCYQATMDWNGALTMCQNYARDFPEEADVWEYNQAVCLRYDRRREESLAILDRLIAGQSQSKVDALLLKAELLGQKRDNDGAIALLNQIVTGYPNSLHAKEAQLEIGVLMLNQGRIVDARDHFDRLAVAEPNDGRWRFGLAYCSYGEQNFAEARDAFQQVLLSFPDGTWRIPANHLYGDCCERLGDSQTAMKSFQEIVDEFPWVDWAKEAEMRLNQFENRHTSLDVPVEVR